MTGKSNPFDIFKNFPHFDPNFLQQFANVDWSDPMEAINSISQSNQEKWPPVNIVESYNEVIVTAELPGLKKTSDVTVKVSGNTMSLEGERALEDELLQNVKVLMQERRQGKFTRTINLPTVVSGKFARATYQHGILEIRLTKLKDTHDDILNIDFLK